tara:strand:- start:7644 stop:7838 length:195 start_codon:yes stop_codon:yes gene_type:complete
MLTTEQIEEHITVLHIAFDPKSPFQGMIDLNSDGGLLTLSIPEQHQVHNAMSPKLKEMVFGPKG